MLKKKASDLLGQGFPREAAAYYTQALQVEPESPALLSERSGCRCGYFDYDGALEDAEECLRIKPGWLKAYVRLGAALHGLKEWERCEAAYLEGMMHDPESAQLQQGLEEARRARAN